MNLLRLSIGLGLAAMVGIAAAQGEISYERRHDLSMGNLMKMRGEAMTPTFNVGRIGYDTSDDGSAWNLALTHFDMGTRNGAGAWALTGKFSRLDPDGADQLNEFLINFDYQINSNDPSEAVQYGITTSYVRTEDLASVFAIGPSISTTLGRDTENPFDLAFTVAYTNVDVDDFGSDSDWVMDLYAGLNIGKVRLDGDVAFESDVSEDTWFLRAGIPVNMDMTQFVRVAAAKHEVFRIEYGIKF